MIRPRKLREALRSPELITDVLQIAKCTVAATIAWWLSVHVLDSQLPFLAPWTALLTVHATVYRSLDRGVQTTVSSTLGIALSFVVGAFLGVNVWTFALALLVGLICSRIRWVRDEGVAIATTAVFVLGSGYDGQAPLLDDRLIEVGVGVLVGVTVNLLVVPPLRDQQAARYVDHINRRMGRVMVDMADALETSWAHEQADAWTAETVALDAELDSAWQTVRFARESERMNPRRYAPRLPRGARGPGRGRRTTQRVGYEEILGRVGEGISHLRHLTRTIHESTYAESRWDDEFREQWAAIVRDAGHAVQDPDAEVEPVQDRLDHLATKFADDKHFSGPLWPVYGSLITSMRHIAVIVDDVASSRRARESTAPNPTS